MRNWIVFQYRLPQSPMDAIFNEAAGRMERAIAAVVALHEAEWERDKARLRLKAKGLGHPAYEG